MAVFTPVTREQLAHWLERYDLGELREFEGIASGIENSNFFVTTSAGRFVLTLFERLGADELPFYLGLMHHLAARGIPCPDPVADRDGASLGRLEGKPAALVTRLEGRAIVHPGPAHCAQVGTLLARMHRAALGYGRSLPNLRGIDWWSRAAPQVMPFLDREQWLLLTDELGQQRAFAASTVRAALPSSAVHADLFRDNVLFVDDRLTGIIDFYYACNDALLYDLAVTVNDWCFEPDGTPNPARWDAMVSAYRSRRELSEAERAAWPLVLRAAALRFWLSRLYDWTFPREGDVVHIKDPEQYRRILSYHREHAPPAL